MTESNKSEEPLESVQEPEGGQVTGIISHLIELRDRLLKVVLGVCLVFLALFPFANQLYNLLALPLVKSLAPGATMVAIDVVSPFLIPFKLVMMLSVFITIPYTLYHVWGFIAPGLYKKEKNLAFPLLVSSTFLFYLGILFAYYLVLPMVFQFLAAIAPESVAFTPDIGRYLDFVLLLFFAFGAAFEIPIATILLVIAGITTPDKLVEKRPYVIVGVFVVGMLLTPPDVISQVMLAIPMWLLFELGIIFSRVILKSRADDAEQDDEEIS